MDTTVAAGERWRAYVVILQQLERAGNTPSSHDRSKSCLGIDGGVAL